jgi:hypothetical protein
LSFCVNLQSRVWPGLTGKTCRFRGFQVASFSPTNILCLDLAGFTWIYLDLPGLAWIRRGPIQWPFLSPLSLCKMSKNKALMRLSDTLYHVLTLMQGK